MVRGEIFRLPAPRGVRGHEQRGARYAIVVQADEFLDLSTVLVSPTSASARPASFRTRIALDGRGSDLGRAGRLYALSAFAPESSARRYAEIYRQVLGSNGS